MFEQLDTPIVLVDLAVVKANLESMAYRANAHGLHLRPHTKTHKSPELAKLQLESGAKGLTVAKLSEAEVMLSAGLNDLLIAYPLVGKIKAYRLAALIAQGLRPTVAIDSVESLETLSLAAEIASSTVDVLIEVDTGFHRCGLPPGNLVTELAQTVKKFPRLRVKGLMSFAGHIAGKQDQQEILRIIKEDDVCLGYQAKELSRVGVPCEVISLGGTILSRNLQHLHHATELRPGIYIFNDMGIVYAGACSIEDCAARVLATVVSHPSPDRVILDCGSKTISSDRSAKGTYGYVVEHPDWNIIGLNEEHAIVHIPNGASGGVGTRVTIIPNHICPVLNLHNTVVGIENGQVVTTIPILGRGCIR